MFGDLRGLLFRCAGEGPKQDMSGMTSRARG
jgi:hypothetical protein